ncbi:hypothetical protein JCM8547_007405 [Rhodosporidiobolus lusitaniae]
MATSLLQKVVGYGYAHKEVPSQVGRKFLITGGTNGIGLSIARTIYANGGDVTVTGSQQEVADAALNYIKTGDLAAAPEDYRAGFGSFHDASGDEGKESGEVSAKVVDFKNLKAVSQAAKELAGKFDRLDGLLGIAGLGVNKYTQTDDGFDAHLTINNLAHIALLSHLLPVLEKTADKPDSDVRIVLMSSELQKTDFLTGPGGTYGDKFRTIEEFKKDIGQDRLYARSKVAVVLEAKALLQRYLKTSKILVHTTHPGGVATGQTGQYEEAYGTVAGKVIQTAVRGLMKSPDDGALSALWAATSPEVRDTQKYPNGSYFTNPQTVSSPSSEAEDQEIIDNFWDNSLKIIKQVAGEDGLGPAFK